MTVYQSKVESLYFFKESTFGTDYSSSHASFQRIPFAEGSATVTYSKPVQTPGHAQQRVDGYPTGVIMPKSGTTLEFTVNLETASTKATSTVASTHTWLTRLFECAFGTYHQVTGTLSSSGWTTVTGDVSVATTLRPGSAIGAVYSSTNALECREIESKTGSTIVLKLALSEAPGTSETLYGSTTVYCSPRVTGYAPGAQFIFQGWNVEDRFVLLGGGCESVTFSLNPGTIPTATFKWKCANWLRADGSENSTDLTGVILPSLTYSDTNTTVVVDSEFRAQTVSTSTLSGSLYQPSTISIELPGLQHVGHMSPSGVQNVVGWVRTHNPPLARVSITLPFENNMEWFDARDNKTLKNLAYQIGSSTSIGAVLFTIPKAQVVDVQRVDIGGIQGQKVDFVSQLDTDITAETSYEALSEAAMRIHFF